MKKAFRGCLAFLLSISCIMPWTVGVFAMENTTIDPISSPIQYYSPNKDYTVIGTIIYRDGKYWDISTSEGLMNYISVYKDTTFTEIFDEIYLRNLNPENGLMRGNPYDLPASTFFTSVSWIYRSSDGWNLSLYPKSETRNRYQYAVTGWGAVVNEQSSNAHWKNADSLQSQYYCHWTFANQKEDWNLSVEIPYRGDMIWDWVANKCN